MKKSLIILKLFENKEVSNLVDIFKEYEKNGYKDDSKLLTHLSSLKNKLELKQKETMDSKINRELKKLIGSIDYLKDVIKEYVELDDDTYKKDIKEMIDFISNKLSKIS